MRLHVCDTVFATPCGSSCSAPVRPAPYSRNFWSGKDIRSGAETATWSARIAFWASAAPSPSPQVNARNLLGIVRAARGCQLIVNATRFRLQPDRHARGAAPARTLRGPEFAPHAQSFQVRTVRIHEALRGKKSHRADQRRRCSWPHKSAGEARRRTAGRSRVRANSFVRKQRERRPDFAMVARSHLRRSHLQPAHLSQQEDSAW